MIALLQRVSEARVTVAHPEADCAPHTVGAIGRGLLVFLAVEPTDIPVVGERLMEKVLNYRVFADAGDRMGLNVQQIDGSVLLVPQFTLAADTRKGLRPSFSTAARPKYAAWLFELAVEFARERYPARVETGRFGADMQVHLVNDGPVTFLLQVTEAAALGANP